MNVEATLLSILVISSCVTAFSHSTPVSQPASSCNGEFDVYFVLDLSSSLMNGRRNHFKEETVSFVKELIDKFTSPLLRLSFITFNTRATVVMSLTNDRAIVDSKLQVLRRAIPDGMTRLGLGIEKVNHQIENYGQKRASVVIVLTDGILEYTAKVKAVYEANKARKFGATILAVGVGDFNPSQLLEIVGGSKHFMFKAASFHDLNAIVARVIDGSCVEIVSATPDFVCSNSTFELVISGKGFNKTGIPQQVKCNYYINERTNFLVNPSSFASNRLTCPPPKDFNLFHGNEVTLQVSLNGGISFISSNVTIKVEVCEHNQGVLWTIMLVTAGVLLAVLWWFWNVICCKTAVDSEQRQAPSRPMPPPLPPPPSQINEFQQWPTVDASFYGGRGAGGMHPMKVSWGDRGCTEGAMHLERTKDAKEVGCIAKEVLIDYHPLKKAPSQTNQSSCLGNMKVCLCCPFTPCLLLFKQLSSRRPNADDAAKCKIIASKKKDNTSKRSSGVSLTEGYLDMRS